MKGAELGSDTLNIQSPPRSYDSLTTLSTRVHSRLEGSALVSQRRALAMVRVLLGVEAAGNVNLS